jgi:hypothetical protein
MWHNMKNKFVLVLSYIHLLYSFCIVVLMLLCNDGLSDLENLIYRPFNIDECYTHYRFYSFRGVYMDGQEFIIAYHFITYLLGSLFYWKSSRNFTILSFVALVPVVIPLFRIESYDNEILIIYVVYLLLLIALGVRKDINTIKTHKHIQ